MNLTPTQLIIIGAAIVFGVPITIGLVVGHFFGFWWGMVSGGLVCLAVAFLGRRHMIRMAKEQEKEDKGNHAE